MKRLLYISLLLVLSVSVYSQTDSVFRFSDIDAIIGDMYEQLVEDGHDIDFEQLTEHLLQLHNEPIDINTATRDDLLGLLVLSDKQIDDILMFVDRSPLHSLWELRLVESLQDYEFRNLLPFITLVPKQKDDKIYVREMFHYAKQEIDLRADARSIETNGNDPFYLSLKYKFNYKNRVQFGLVAERDAKEPFYFYHKTYGADFYGGYLQLDNFSHLRRLVVGDYKASFGEGLVINTQMTYGGKLAQLLTNGARRDELQRKTSTAEYDFLRGAGATFRIGKADVSAFYSARKVDGRASDGYFPAIQHTGYHRSESELSAKREVWQQIVGTNLSLRFRTVKIGFTAVANLLGDTLRPVKAYYNANYFRGKQQIVVGSNFRWFYKKVTWVGELATMNNSQIGQDSLKWGVALLTSLRYQMIKDLAAVATYRYYSPHADNLLASGFGETSRLNDENGLMLGMDWRANRCLRIDAYADVFHFVYAKYQLNKTNTTGVDACVKVDWQKNDFGLSLKARNKLKGIDNKTSLRANLSIIKGRWKSQTIMEGNFVIELPTSMYNMGGAVAQQVEYNFQRVPIVLQLRGELFHAKNYANRVYLYENDVLYAFSIPMLYGVGGRYYLNGRYKISKHVSLYVKMGQTFYTRQWQKQRSALYRHLTELNTMLKINI